MGVALHEDSIVVRRPIAQVFAFVANPANDWLWHTPVVEVRQTSLGPVGVGTTFAGIYDPKKRTLDSPVHPNSLQAIEGVLVEVDPERSSRLRVRFVNPPRGLGARVLGPAFDLTFRFEAVPGGTRVYRGGELNPWSLMRPLVRLLLSLNAKRFQYLLGLLRDAIERLPPIDTADRSPLRS
jgi:hypothetical protein